MDCIKKGKYSEPGRVNDRTGVEPFGIVENSMISYLSKQGIQLSLENLAALRIKNTPRHTEAYAWMFYFFNMIGDFMPNGGEGEIHLEPVEITSIHSEYCNECENGPLGYKDFLTLWKSCFPNVKIRECKGVTGMHL